MTLLHIICSSRGTSSESARVSALIVEFLLEQNPELIVIQRDLGFDAPPQVDEEYAQALIGLESKMPRKGAVRSLDYSETVIGEIESANIIVIGTPIHNFTLPSVLKAWIDHVVRANKTFGYTAGGKIGLLSDRPVFVAIASGGVHAGDRASQPDFLTPYLKAILGTIGLHDITFFRMQGLARGETAIQDERLKVQAALRSHFARIANH